MKNRLSLLTVGAFFASIGFGQGGLATITGTITDASGAVIPNAPVVVRNLETGQVSNAASSDSGSYTVSQLVVGDYELTVTVMGFKTYQRSGFRLAASQTFREDVTLEIGQTTDSVTVTAEASLLKTESSDVTHNVTLAQMNNLPMLIVGATNQGFRDPLSATRLVPGVRYANGAAINTMVINGTPANSIQTRLDGATMNPTSARLLGATGQTQASVDALEEVAIQTSNFAAEYGTAGGAVINMVTKSGTNAFHGSVYDYLRHESLDSRQPYTGLRNKVRQHDWGFTIGGPVKIPKIYDGTSKTFFFWSYERFINNQIFANPTTTVPIPAYRAGDFSNLIQQENRVLNVAGPGGTRVPWLDPLGRETQSGAIFDPLTERLVDGVLVRDPFQGNQLPVSRYDPISSEILGLVPQPWGRNADLGQAGQNYQVPYDTSRVSTIPSIKVDQNLGTKNRVSFYFQQTTTDTPRTPTGADAYPDLITASVRSKTISNTARINWDYTVTPRLLLHFGAGWNDTDFRLVSPVIDYDAMAELGLRQALVRNFPRIGTSSQSNALGGMSALGTTTQESYFERRPAGNVSATYVTGGHTFKLGAEYRLEKFPNYALANTAGTYTFGSNWTQQTAQQGVAGLQGFSGFSFASFLLGGFNGMSMNAPIQAAPYKSQWALFLQDNWKVTRKLTLDLGLRWDYGTYAREQHGRYSSLGLTIPNTSAAGRLGAREYESVCACNFADNYPYAIGPRLGVSYQINPKTVIRGGFGVVYNATGTTSGSAVNNASAGNPAFGQVVGFLQDGTPDTVQPAWPTFDPAAGHPVGEVVGASLFLDANAGRPARLYQWNVTVQRELTRNFVVEAAYVANRGVWWSNGAGLAPNNVLSQDVLRQYGFTNFTSASEARLLTQIYTNLTAGERSTLASRGITAQPYANFPRDSQIVRQSLLPYPQYTGTIAGSGAPLGKSWYDSLQITATQRFSHGLSFNLNYNFSKNMELYSTPDPFNRAWGKDLGGFDLPHQLRFTAQYVVPSLKTTGIPVLSNSFVSYILSDWGMGWYVNYQSAGLVGRPGNGGPTPISQFLGYGPGGAQLKKDAFGEFMNPWSVDWVDYDGNHRTDPIDINCSCFDPTKTIVLNPNAWENLPAGTWAPDQSALRFYRGRRFPTESANFSRNFRMGPEGRFVLNVRIEFQNVFNRMQWPGIGGGNFLNPPTVFAPGSANSGLYSGGFGTIVPVNGTAGARTGSAVARITF